ncbi:uncharacterized protein LOC122035090 [Zingiber officinale]|uniref:uncharacterized protein LOC122035090 n=1 Tax=Zingiber officinale TaxID=94328 RepID=UPI001C4AE72F|nr:uncharacterized protein LOC122035090 [Zingiber officinale]
MSDKQKGLIPAFKQLFPNAENRFCVRHLYSNMKHNGFRSVAVKNALWAAARATRIEVFKRRMEELKKIDENAYQWLAKKPEHHWSRSHFSIVPKCDILLNNMCECFNSFILDAREKSIIPMFEAIRNLLIVRFQMNRAKAEKWNGVICPKIKAVLGKNYLEASRYSPMMSDETHYQIMGSNQQHSVDLCRMICSCRKWDLTGIPCPHAICAILCKREDPEAYVHRHYSVEAYKRCYNGSIMPINGPDLWSECHLIPPLAPVFKERVGRPAKLRMRDPDELPASKQTKLTGLRRNNKCKSCCEIGHNQRSCKIPKSSDLDHTASRQSKGIDHELVPRECNEMEIDAHTQCNGAMPNEGERIIPTKEVVHDTLVSNKREKLQVIEIYTY